MGPNLVRSTNGGDGQYLIRAKGTHAITYKFSPRKQFRRDSGAINETALLHRLYGDVEGRYDPLVNANPDDQHLHIPISSSLPLLSRQGPNSTPRLAFSPFHNVNRLAVSQELDHQCLTNFYSNCYQNVKRYFEISYLTAWLGRELAALPFVYLFLDAFFLPFHQGRGAARRRGPLRLRGPYSPAGRFSSTSPSGTGSPTTFG